MTAFYGKLKVFVFAFIQSGPEKQKKDDVCAARVTVLYETFAHTPLRETNV